MKNKVAVITGAGGNIGGITAEILARSGVKVAVCDFSEESANARVEKIINAGGCAKAYVCNVKDYNEVVATCSGIYKDFGSIDFLVCSAGGSAREKCTTFVNQDIDVIYDVIGVNLYGAIHFNKACAKYMIDNGFGRIVNISSIVALQGLANCAEYGASKGGILALTKTLAQELGEYNITVNCVSPGLVRRPDEINRGVDYSQTNYLHRNCTAEDIAYSVEFLLSDKGSFITGQNIVCDGGRSLGVKRN